MRPLASAANCCQAAKAIAPSYLIHMKGPSMTHGVDSHRTTLHSGRWAAAQHLASEWCRAAT